MDLWHCTPDSWTCPSLTNAIDPSMFFDTADEGTCDNISVEDPNKEPNETTYDFCLCCGEAFHENPPDWSRRRQHLEEDHNFDESTHEKFFREEQFLLHLANGHKVRLEYLTPLMEFCGRQDQAPVLLARLPG